MAATANIAIRRKNVQNAVSNDHPVKAATHIYAGAAVGEDSGVARGLVAGDVFLGFAVGEEDNSTGAAAARRVAVEAGMQVELDVTGASATSIGEKVYASADNAFTLTAGSNSLIGYVRQHISGTKCWVETIATRA